MIDAASLSLAGATTPEPKTARDLAGRATPKGTRPALFLQRIPMRSTSLTFWLHASASLTALALFGLAVATWAAAIERGW